MHARVSWQLLCRVGFPLERKVQGGEHPVTLLKSLPLSCHPRVLPDLAAPGTPGLAESLGRAVMEILTKVKLSIIMIPGNRFPRGERHSDH